MTDRRRTGIVAAVAVALGIAFLLAPPMGTDLSAQVARADFVRAFGATPMDFRWYGGTNQYGYSLVSPVLMALAGPRVLGTLAAIASGVLFVVLLARTGARRPLLGGVLGVLCFFGNLASGRMTYALGVAFGLGALVALTTRSDAGVASDSGTYPMPVPRRGWWIVAIGAAVLASATSPVAGLFLGLVGVALVAAGRWRDGIAIAIASAVPLGVTSILFGEGGRMNIGWSDAVRAIVASLAVAALVRSRTIRIGASLSAAGVLLALAVHTPVGLNATRLATMFALPVLAAYATVPRIVTGRALGWVLATVLIALVAVSPPVVVGDVADAGNPTAAPEYFAPLLARLAEAGPIGRIEIPPTRDYWEAAYAVRGVPLARGWLRQVDIARNPLFFDGRLSAERYRAWLVDNGVSFVAVPDAALSWVGRAEARIVEAGPAYLSLVWRGPHWRLYRVADDPSIVDARLVASTGDRVVFDVDRPGDVLVRVRWSRTLRVTSTSGATVCPRASGRWISVPVPAPGRWTVSGGLSIGGSG